MKRYASLHTGYGKGRFEQLYVWDDSKVKVEDPANPPMVDIVVIDHTERKYWTTRGLMVNTRYANYCTQDYYDLTMKLTMKEYEKVINNST